MYQQKVVGQPCSEGCGGTYVSNPKTGKIFCDNKCWLTAGQLQNAPQGVKQPVGGDKQPDWDKIALGKVRHGIACAFIQAGKQFNPAEMQPWVDWVMDQNSPSPAPAQPASNIPF